MKQSHIIIKELQNGRKQSIVLLNIEEIWEFEDFEEAERIAKAFEINSDSGWKYKVKSIKSI
jgi:hypothetical protein